MANPGPAIPPASVPEDQAEDVGKLTKALSVVLVSKEIPWRVQGELGREGYVTVEDLADRWNSPEDARANGPHDLDFEAGNHGFTAQSTAFTAMRLLQAVRAAQQIATLPGGTSALHPLARGVTTAGSTLEASFDRRALEETYMKVYSQNRPKLETQGSDALLRRQYRFVRRGEIGFIQVKHLVSALPEEGERPTTTSNRFTLDGFEGTEEEEIRANPATRRQLERMHAVFRTTLLMCTASVPQFSNLTITKQELDDWYDWFYGEDIAGRFPPPSEAVLLYAERNAWRKIHDMVHGGMPLSEALKPIKADLLFWTREVYERVSKTTAKGFTTKGKGKIKQPARSLHSPWQPMWNKPQGKGEGPSPSKGNPPKGNTKGKPDWPAHWAFKNPKNVNYCRDHLLYKNCSGQCGRSHNCPVRVGGWICDAAPGTHLPEECPHIPD